MKNKALLFDFGGTLDTNGIHWSEKFWDVYQKFYPELKKQEYEQAYVIAERNISEFPSKEKMKFKEILTCQVFLQSKMLATFPSLYQTFSNADLLYKISDYCYKDVCETIQNSQKILSELKKYYKLGIVSNFYGNLALVCKEFGIYHLFDVIVDSEICGIRKPDPGIFSYALEKLKLKSSETFVIGDSYERDIAPSKKIGCSTIWLDGRSWKKPDEISKADYIIKSLSELNDILINNSIKDGMEAD
jgi:FMN phosphatase YigB (HAD superfamily)